MERGENMLEILFFESHIPATGKENGNKLYSHKHFSQNIHSLSATQILKILYILQKSQELSNLFRDLE